MRTPLLIRSHEIMDYKRCPKMWYWKWRLGLVPKEKSFGALDLGTWLHDALAHWYMNYAGKHRTGAALAVCFDHFALKAIDSAPAKTPQHVVDKAQELYKLGQAMLISYAKEYQGDRNWIVIGAEIPLEVEITDKNDQTIGLYRLKLDLAIRERTTGKIWIIEHKSAKTIRTEHLTIDGQARPYGALAEIAMRHVGVLSHTDVVEGILYNYLRKTMPDVREVDTKGLALNKDGTVSKRQPSPMFKRHPVTLTRRAKAVALKRIQRDVTMLTKLRNYLVKHREFADRLPKTAHWSCPRWCQYFAMCELEEQGGKIDELRRGTFVRQDPYQYETTDENFGFEMG